MFFWVFDLLLKLSLPIFKWYEYELSESALIVSGELRSVINVLNRQYGAGAARDVKVTLKLKNKMPSQHFKTKRDFLAQLKFALLKTPEKSKTRAE